MKRDTIEEGSYLMNLAINELADPKFYAVVYLF